MRKYIKNVVNIEVMGFEKGDEPQSLLRAFIYSAVFRMLPIHSVPLWRIELLRLLV